MARSASLFLLLIGATLVGTTGCKEKTPARNQIPILKEALYQLQEAVKGNNHSSLDSLLSIKMLGYNQNGDSLVAHTKGLDGSFLFEKFGEAVFLYTGDNAQIECFVMDSTSRHDRPIHIHMVREGKRWLVSHYSIPVTPVGDST